MVTPNKALDTASVAPIIGRIIAIGAALATAIAAPYKKDNKKYVSKFKKGRKIVSVYK